MILNPLVSFQDEITKQEPPYCLDILIEKLNELQK